MATQVSKVVGWASLPNPLLVQSLSFLCAPDVARVESVCKNWQSNIGSSAIWKSLCAQEKIPLEAPGPEKSKRNYKQEFAAIVRANIQLAESAVVFSLASSAAATLAGVECRWGVEKCGSYVNVRLRSPNGDKHPPPLALADFPRAVPLFLLLNKTDGAVLRILFKGTRCVLRCTSSVENQTWTQKPEQCVKQYAAGTNNEKQKVVAQQALAQSLPIWIDAQFRGVPELLQLLKARKEERESGRTPPAAPLPSPLRKTS